MKIYVDIDGTICERTEGGNYHMAVAKTDNILKVNQLYQAGHTITYWTARGSATGKDWRELTESQLKRWGCLYHELKLGKEPYDVFIDDKCLNADDWTEQGNSLIFDNFPLDEGDVIKADASQSS